MSSTIWNLLYAMHQSIKAYCTTVIGRGMSTSRAKSALPIPIDRNPILRLDGTIIQRRTLYIHTALPRIMILPAFDPPQFDAMSKWWRTCTYADVHRLILEVLHLRLTLCEASNLADDAARMIAYLEQPDTQKYSAPLRLLKIKMEREIRRAGRMANPREQIAPFSDEWRAREATRCLLRGEPAEPDPGSDRATKLPDFQRVTWAELRTAWSATEFKKDRPLTQQQRFVLEIVHVRRALRRMEQLVSAAEQELKKDRLPDLFALDQLRRMIDVTLSD